MGEGAGGAGGSGGGTDVAQHADAAAQGGVDVGTQQGVARHGDDDKQDVDKDEGESLTHLMFRHYLLADTYTEDGSRMEHEDELVEHALGADDDAYHLDAARRAARTGTDSHDDHRGHPERGAPRHIVELLGREAGARRHAADMEECRAERLLEALRQGVLGTWGREQSRRAA